MWQHIFIIFRLNNKDNSLNIIGFDVSKDTIDCRLIKVNKKQTEEYYLKQENTMSGFKEIHKLIKKQRIRKLSVVMEATGIYYEEVANYFSQYYDVYVVNPLKIKEHSKKTFNRTKTDKADAKLIADYGQRYVDKLTPYQKPSIKHYRLNKLNILKEQLKAEITRHKNQIHVSKDDFITRIHTDLITELEKRQKEVQQQIIELIHESEELCQHFKNLMTIPCMNENTASVLLHILATKSFPNANKFMAYAGLSPQIFESGTSVKKPDKLSRLGNMRVKSAMFMPAISAMRTNYFKEFVARLRANGKKPKVIVVALMRKLLKIAYSIYKTNKPFSKEYKFN